ncbi:Severe Depolymerization of Actin [Ascosphaera aggregata]|nr:Severe Depolymerization of Actin [Ascosphaera aggregata]
MGKRKLGALEKVEADLYVKSFTYSRRKLKSNLQHKIKKDPKSYLQDFRSQYLQYENFRDMYLLAPATTDDKGIISLRDLIMFIGHVAECYPEQTKAFPTDLITILKGHHAVLEQELREKVVGALCQLRKKEVIDSVTLLQTLFPVLVSTPSKIFRALLFQKIISDLRASNSKTINHKLNRAFQSSLLTLVTDDRTSAKSLWAIKITREMWKRQLWSDAKAVEIMKETALADNEKVIVAGVRFFLGGDKEREELENEESGDETVDVAKVRHVVGINKKSRKSKKQVEKAIAMSKRKDKKKNSPHPLNFSALHLLHDPQGFAEQLFSKHLQNAKTKLNLEQKLLVLQLVSRLVGSHELDMLQLYSYFIKFLTPRQPSVTTFLACLAQATHKRVPPEELEPLITKIANEFVSEASAAEVASAGLNAIREVCVRQPLAMNDTLLQDLVQYRKSKDKGVMMAARGLLSLYREVGADMLRKRDRGKDAAIALKSGTKKRPKYGEEEVTTIEGIELFEKWKEQERRARRREKGLPSDGEDDDGEEEEEEAENWKKWEIDENDEDSDDSGGWINVESDGEDIHWSDSSDDDDEPKAKKAKSDIDTEDGEKKDKEQEEESSEEREKRITQLLTSTILTPADLQKLKELQAQQSVMSHLPNAKRRNAKNAGGRNTDDPITADDIEGLAALSHGKPTREERIAHIKSGQLDRSEHKGRTARKKEQKIEQGKSTTNKEKARKKNFMMMLGKAKSKGKRSLTETRKVLKSHQERQKRGGRRGNFM